VLNLSSPASYAGNRMTDAAVPLEPGNSDHADDGEDSPSRFPRWVLPAIGLFWGGYVLTIIGMWAFGRLSGLFLLLLVSLFLSLAIEPAVNRLASRGWRRGRATALILLIVVIASAGFVAAISTLIGRQIADLLRNTDQYVDRTVTFINDLVNTNIDPQDVNREIQDENGGFQRFITSQGDNALKLSGAAIGGLLQVFSALLFTFYLVADGPRLRRVICSRLRPSRQMRVLQVWDLAINKTGGYLYSRALLAGLSALFHWVAFTLIEVPAPIALAIWVGLISQFIPVVGTYIAGLLPVIITLVNPDSSPLRALAVVAVILVYQQIENYFFAPRITARTMELHPAVSFGAALAGAALLGPVGAVLALPAAAMGQAIGGEWGKRHRIVDSPLTQVDPPIVRKPPSRRRRGSPSPEL
jgi:predicted PurR-regulated permease PerM